MEVGILRSVPVNRATAPPEVDVIGLGENSVDRVLTVPHLPGAADAASKMRVASATRSCGGQVATAVAACAALGLRASYAGATGDDDDGRLVRETLSTRDVHLHNLHTVTGAPTRWATILLDPTGERVVLWDRDERLSLTDAQVAAIDVGAARLIHVDDTDVRASIQLATMARAAGKLVTTDIDAGAQVRGAEVPGAGARVLLTLATHPILSEEALAVLSGEADPERGLRALRRECAGVLCVTLGARGALALEGDILLSAPGIPVTPVDTTGAGDVFRAGFIFGLLAGWPVAETLRFANRAAALSCTRLGAISGVPTLAEITQ
jgi:sulfofructose kinase